MPLRHPLPGETTVTVIRRHWVIFLKNLTLNMALMLAPFPVLWFLKTYFPPLFLQTSISWALIVIFISTYALLILLLTYVHFIDLYLDVWILTNKRVLNINQLGMFSRIESEHAYNKIQDITIEVNGILATLFNFGDLHVQTAGEKERFIFKNAPEPYLLKKTLTSLARASAAGTPPTDPSVLKNI